MGVLNSSSDYEARLKSRIVIHTLLQTIITWLRYDKTSEFKSFQLKIHFFGMEINLELDRAHYPHEKSDKILCKLTDSFF